MSVNPGMGGGNKFQSANGNLQRPVVQMGAVNPDQMMRGAPIRQDGSGNVAVAVPIAPQVTQVPIGKGAEGVRGTSPIRLMGQNPFAHEMGSPAPAQFQPAPAPAPMPQPAPRFAPPPPPAPPAQHHPQLGANQEVHVLVATLEGPSGQKYEAVYEVVAQERGSRVLGVTERPGYY